MRKYYYGNINWVTSRLVTLENLITSYYWHKLLETCNGNDPTYGQKVNYDVFLMIAPLNFVIPYSAPPQAQQIHKAWSDYTVE